MPPDVISSYLSQEQFNFVFLNNLLQLDQFKGGSPVHSFIDD